jgi:hypothetical protein
MSRTLCHTALIVLFAAASHAQTPNSPGTPDFAVQIWGQAATDFDARVRGYAALRATLENGLPAQTITADAAEIRAAELALAQKIRTARKKAKQGDIFTSRIAREFRKALLLEMSDDTLETIRDDNPGEFSIDINGDYPKNRPLSTVPINILARLPRLPDDIEYRFLGGDFILFDTRANVIVDRITCAIPGPDRVGCHR